MASEEQLLRELVGSSLSGKTGACADGSVALLQSLANSLRHIIGEDGFDSLLFRTAHRVGNDFPWLRFDPRTRPADPEFGAFRRCFEGQEPGQVQAANMLFFSTFVDVLASLIGAHLTTLILKSALGGARTGTSSKEQNDE
ncbi:MAG: hypothetical protein ACXWVG_01815 [Telluria sp.]